MSLAPEERAHQVQVNTANAWNPDEQSLLHCQLPFITAAIREAVTEEREALKAHSLDYAYDQYGSMFYVCSCGEEFESGAAFTAHQFPKKAAPEKTDAASSQTGRK